MSHHPSIPSGARPSTVARLSAAVRRNWTEARFADRQLMAMRTNLTRHVG